MRSGACALFLATIFAPSLRAQSKTRDAPVSHEPPFELLASPATDAVWVAIKYDRTSGQAWVFLQGKWVGVEDKKAVQKSSYKIVMIPLKGDFGAIRMDLNSGKSWRLQHNEWLEME